MNLTPPQNHVIDFVNAGAQGFIMNAGTLKDFVKTIQAVHEGKNILPPSLADSLFSQIVELASRQSKRSILTESVQLTQREQKIMARIAKGHSNNRIAQALRMSVQEVKTHVQNILDKLTVRSHLELSEVPYRNPEIRNSPKKDFDKDSGDGSANGG
jgi:DNA-binding NarL/FixJ family response regulator